MHPILEYIDRKGLASQAEFARVVGLSPQFITDLIKGRAFVGRKSGLKIQAGTNGALTVQELMTWEAARAKRRVVS